MKNDFVNCRTLKKEVVLSGIGVHTGLNSNVRLIPSTEKGIYFKLHKDGEAFILDLSSKNVKDAMNQVTIGNDIVSIKLVEHLLSAFHGLGITNCIVESFSSELPGMDGSSYPFVNAIKDCGIVDLDETLNIFKLPFPVWVGDEDSYLLSIPNDELIIDYTHKSKYKAIGEQSFCLTLNEENYIKEISKARTFGFIEDHEKLLNRGICKGSSFDNTLVMSRDKILSPDLRFINEPARHKILDIIGDLYILSVPIKAKIIAKNSSHRLDIELVKKLEKIREVNSFTETEISRQFDIFKNTEFIKKIFC